MINTQHSGASHMGFKSLSINVNSFLQPNKIIASNKTQTALSVSNADDNFFEYLSKGLDKQKKDAFVEYNKDEETIQIKIIDTKRKNPEDKHKKPVILEQKCAIQRITDGNGLPRKLSATALLKQVKQMLKENDLYEERKPDLV